MWKILILVLVGYILYRLFANDIKKKMQKNDDIEEKEKKVATGEMVIDPECGIYIDSESSISIRNDDKIYKFCSYECRDAFLKKIETPEKTLPHNEKD